MPYAGGLPGYRERCDTVRDSGYEGFEFDGVDQRRRVDRSLTSDNLGLCVVDCLGARSIGEVEGDP